MMRERVYLPLQCKLINKVVSIEATPTAERMLVVPKVCWAQRMGLCTCAEEDGCLLNEKAGIRVSAEMLEKEEVEA